MTESLMAVVLTHCFFLSFKVNRCINRSLSLLSGSISTLKEENIGEKLPSAKVSTFWLLVKCLLSVLHVLHGKNSNFSIMMESAAAVEITFILFV